LILNEVITNAFKYAFPWSENDRITIRLSADDRWITLFISDNGRGLPAGYDVDHQESFGMLLISGLTEDLDGTLHIESHDGTSYTIRFRQESRRGGLSESRYFAERHDDSQRASRPARRNIHRTN
jgi:two-component sensor histidine kinase